MVQLCVSVSTCIISMAAPCVSELQKALCTSCALAACRSAYAAGAWSRCASCCIFMTCSTQESHSGRTCSRCPHAALQRTCCCFLCLFSSRLFSWESREFISPLMKSSRFWTLDLASNWSCLISTGPTSLYTAASSASSSSSCCKAWFVRVSRTLLLLD